MSDLIKKLRELEEKATRVYKNPANDWTTARSNVFHADKPGALVAAFVSDNHSNDAKAYTATRLALPALLSALETATAALECIKENSATRGPRRYAEEALKNIKDILEVD